MSYLLGFNTICQTIALVWRLDSNRRQTRVWRYIIKSLLHPVASVRWALALWTLPELRIWLRNNPRILLKPGRNYLNRNYSFSDRAKVVLSHYSLLSGLVSRSTIESLSNGNALLLATIEGKNGVSYQVTLSKTSKYDREGEAVLGLMDTTQQVQIWTFVFTLTGCRVNAGIEIGCMQGTKDQDARELIKRATKELHGIRPINLLTDAIYEIKREWNIANCYGVCNVSRVYNGKSTYLDYDAFWLELGGVINRDEMFRLPHKLEHRLLMNIPSHHRSEYKRRTALRLNLSTQISLNLKALRSPEAEKYYVR
ncbi:MAG: DUF535 family protein [Gallionella sp.]